MLKHYELYFIDIIKGKRQGFVPFMMKGALKMLSWGYRLGVFFRNHAYDQGWLRQYYPPVAVVSIGNIVSGGTGKTPATLMLAKQFGQDVQVAVLSRGYRAPVEKLLTPIVISGGQGPVHPASFCGDEPYLLAQNLPDAFIIVGRDRRKGSAMAVAAGAQLILLDDGMQHRRLARDFEVVVMDGNDPFGQDDFLPAGFLREHLSSLGRADLIIINHVQTIDCFHAVKERVGRYSRAPVVATQVHVSHMSDLKGKEIKSLQGKKVGMFCGIAQPAYFKKTLEEMGAVVVAENLTADHVALERDMLDCFAAECLEKGADYMVCTEKDKVRLPEQLSTPMPVAWLQVELILSFGNEHWREFLDAVRKKVV